MTALELMFHFGADPNITNLNGETPLLLLCKSYFIFIIRNVTKSKIIIKRKI